MKHPVRPLIDLRRAALFGVVFASLCLSDCGSCGGSEVCNPSPEPGCGADCVLASHSPVHPGNMGQVIFWAEAKGDVAKIELAYQRFALSAVNGVISSTPDGAPVVVKTCDPPQQSIAWVCSEVYQPGFPAGSLIAFTATATYKSGAVVKDSYSFAAGDYPLPDDPIPIRVTGRTADHLDAVFVPDTDFTADDFRLRLHELIFDRYFRQEEVEANRGFHNFYYTPRQGHYEEPCQFTKPPNAAKLVAVADSVVILHQKSKPRDCSYTYLMSAHMNDTKTVLHESGHSLFGLEDEYCCDSDYQQATCLPNIWATLAACQRDAPALHLDSGECRQLSDGGKTVNFWRIDPVGDRGCIMGDAEYKSCSDFGPACLRRIRGIYGNCQKGACFPLANPCPT